MNRSRSPPWAPRSGRRGPASRIVPYPDGVFRPCSGAQQQQAEHPDGRRGDPGGKGTDSQTSRCRATPTPVGARSARSQGGVSPGAGASPPAANYPTGDAQRRGEEPAAAGSRTGAPLRPRLRRLPAQRRGVLPSHPPRVDRHLHPQRGRLQLSASWVARAALGRRGRLDARRPRTARALAQRFPNEKTKATSYALLRSMQIRRLRLPWPRAKPGATI